jgi:formylmethanofuran dehydrogenase subunit E
MTETGEIMCDGCGEMFIQGTLHKVNGQQICDECLRSDLVEDRANDYD